MTSILIKKRGPENIFSCHRGLRGKMFENHCTEWLPVYILIAVVLVVLTAPVISLSILFCIVSSLCIVVSLAVINDCSIL
jgi:hypothetical protein